MARRFNLESRARLNTEVLSAQWITARTHWRVVTRNAEGEERVYTARVLVSGVGALSIPRDCDVPGWESFKGPLFHSAHWPKNTDLTGKKIVILGEWMRKNTICVVGTPLRTLSNRQRMLSCSDCTDAGSQGQVDHPDCTLWRYRAHRETADQKLHSFRQDRSTGSYRR